MVYILGITCDFVKSHLILKLQITNDFSRHKFQRLRKETEKKVHQKYIEVPIYRKNEVRNPRVAAGCFS